MALDALLASDGQFRRFWEWWTGELKSLMPEKWLSERRLARPYLLLSLKGELCVLTACKRSGDVEIGRAEGDIEHALNSLVERRHRKLPILVRLDKGLGLRKHLDLPCDAHADLDRLLFYELDRLTPFNAADVCFTWQITNYNRKSGRMTVRIDLAPKVLIEQVQKAIRRVGCKPLSITLEGEEDSVLDLTPRSPAKATRASRWQRILPILVVGLIILVVAVPLRQQMLAISQIDTEIEKVQAAAEESGDLQEQLQRLTDRSGFLIEKKNRYLPRTNTMNALTRLIPDQAYITQIQIRDEEIVLVGHADRASELIGALEQSPMFSSPRFQSPLTRDSRTGKERFQIAFDLARDDS